MQRAKYSQDKPEVEQSLNLILSDIKNYMLYFIYSQ